MNNKTSENSICTNEQEVKNMPMIDVIEYERVTYVKEMQDYLQKLKKMNKKEAQKKSFQNLVLSDIIHENGDFTEHYEYTKIMLRKKR